VRRTLALRCETLLNVSVRGAHSIQAGLEQSSTPLRVVSRRADSRLGEACYNGGMSSESDKVVFNAFDPQGEVDRSCRNLPHWFQSNVAIFLTFRTADSMPREVVERWEKEQKEWLLRHGLGTTLLADLAQLPQPVQSDFRRFRDRLWHGSLDNCHGACLLRQPKLAKIVGDALRYFDGNRYDLDSFVIMPNHVHLLVQFRPPTTLKAQAQSWLRFSAREINKQLGRSGTFWQSEPFDHLVRSSEQFEYLQRYITDNPKKANLREGEYLYWSRVTRPE